MAQQGYNKANNSLAPTTGNSTVIDPTNMKPTAFFTSAAVRKLITSTLQNEQKASIIVSTLISILGISPRFQNCNSLELLGNVLRHEIGMGLSWAMGDYAVIDYGGKPTFQMQYQGVAKMAFASGEYADGDWYEVREGEYKGLDPRTRRPVIQWIENDEERLSKPIVGYYVWVQLIDKPPHNGKIVSLYMSHDAILHHADTYSKPFQNCGGYKAYKAAMDGKGNFVKNGNTPWMAPPDSTAHMKMCKKTVLLQLLKNPFLPKSNGIFDRYIEADELQERTGEAPTYSDEYERMAQQAAFAAAQEAITAPQTQNAPAIPAAPEPIAQPVVEAPRPVEAPAPVQTPAPAPAKRGRPSKAQNAAKSEPQTLPAEQPPVGNVSVVEPDYPGTARYGNVSQPPKMDFPDMRGEPFPDDPDDDDGIF